MRIHIFGASGSGTTTLGNALANRLGCPHFDADDYYWVRTEPPFRTKRPPEERVALLRKDLEAQAWVLSGSMVRWGDPLVHRFTAAVFVYTAPAVRLERLRERERSRYGSRIEEGGDMHQQHREFIDWARAYDEPRTDLRSKLIHEAWIEKLTCRVMRFDGALPVAQLVEEVIRGLN
jgi:adenylate kinase family enzyme